MPSDTESPDGVETRCECPSCGDILLGVSMREALEHLFRCDRSPGYYVMGVKPAAADELFRSVTGEAPPQIPTHERVEKYWKWDK